MSFAWNESQQADVLRKILRLLLGAVEKSFMNMLGVCDDSREEVRCLLLHNSDSRSMASRAPEWQSRFFVALLSALYSAVSRSETQYSCGWVFASSHSLFLWLLHFSPPLSYIHLFFSAPLTVRTSLEKCIFRHSWSRTCCFLFPRTADSDPDKAA